MTRIVGMHHKCASSWIFKLFKALGRQASFGIGVVARLENIDSINNRNLWIVGNCEYPKSVDAKIINIVRDPRDILVSAYFSHKYSHPFKNWDALMGQRKFLEESSFEDGLVSELEFSKQYFEDLRSWNVCDDKAKTFKYEDIFQNEKRFLRISCDHLRMRLPNNLVLLGILKSYSFSSLSGGRGIGEENKHHHYRKGISGDWKNHFTPKVIDFFKDRYGDLLLQYGYESNNDWQL